MGNPPYSAGQTSANDNNANIAYPKLDDSIAKSYSKHSQATLQRNLYDSYVRAIRWASDRIGNSGVIGFVSGNGLLKNLPRMVCVNVYPMNLAAYMFLVCAKIFEKICLAEEKHKKVIIYLVAEA